MPVPVGHACLAIVIGYALGCFMTGYYLVRLCTCEDIRQLGSGNVGATNVGRRLGAWGFVVTFVGDAGKGALAVAIARLLSSSLWITDAAMIAVVAGHIWPLPLGGRGGKGIATALGALTTLEPRLTLLLLVLFGLIFAAWRNKTGSALAAILLCPLLAALLRFPLPHLLGLIVLGVLLVFAHRDNLRERVFGSFPRRSASIFPPLSENAPTAAGEKRDETL